MLDPGRTRLGAFAVACFLCPLIGTPLFAAPKQSAPAKKPSPKIDFERHLMGLFGRMGCNSGSCHGSFQGRGGFRLSLFGYDPEKDYLALTRDMMGRRINRVEPDRSLLLLKASGQVEHGGGKRFAKGSWQYQLFRDWIVAGTPWQKGRGEVTAISIDPPEYAFQQPGQVGQLLVQARFTDGSTEDITRFCDFRTNDDTVAEVSPLGQVKALRPGDTAVVVSYRGQILPVRVLVPVAAAPGFQYPALAEVNYIDREVFAKLRRLNIVPSELSSDEEFLRRVTIDTIGCLPSPEEVRTFLADSDPEKRAKKIDTLLAHPLHAAIWATKFSDITGNDTDRLEAPRELQPKRSQMWFDWLRKRFAENRPYDELVRGILCATSREGMSPEEWLKQVKELDQAALTGFPPAYADRQTLDLFWRRQANVPIEQWGEKTAAAFMGIRLECAQCHKHPFDRWTQADYRAYANVFGKVAVNASPDTKPLVDAENAERKKQNDSKAKDKKKPPLVLVREVYVGGKGQSLPNPDGKKALPPKALGGPVLKPGKDEDPRVLLYNWLVATDNPYFARSLVNRVWGHYLGVGVVDPVDNFSLANPPSNEKLLAALAKDFVDHHYDLRALERAILNSHVYQLSSAANATNRLDRNNYSHAYVRPMMAEVVMDVIDAAVGVGEKFGTDAPPDCRAIEVGASRVQNGNLAYALRIFGRPPRTSACDCERALDPALPQTLYRMTDAALLAKLPRGRLAGLLKSKKTDQEILDELFLATLTRFPSEDEKQLFATYRASRKDRQTAFTDTLWALINTREFILNH
jgi:hypothetical protein